MGRSASGCRAAACVPWSCGVCTIPRCPHHQDASVRGCPGHGGRPEASFGVGGTWVGCEGLTWPLTFQGRPVSPPPAWGVPVPWPAQLCGCPCPGPDRDILHASRQLLLFPLIFSMPQLSTVKADTSEQSTPEWGISRFWLEMCLWRSPWPLGLL